MSVKTRFASKTGPSQV